MHSPSTEMAALYQRLGEPDESDIEAASNKRPGSTERSRAHQPEEPAKNLALIYSTVGLLLAIGLAIGLISGMLLDRTLLASTGTDSPTSDDKA